MHYRRAFLLAALAAGFLMTAGAQTAPDPTPAPAPAATSGGALASIMSADNIAPVAFLLSNVADAQTDWHFNLGTKAYTVTPAQRLSIAGGGMFAALAIRHFYPRTAKPLNVVLTIATCYFAGRAYANTYNHGAAPSAPAARAPLAFAVRLH